MVENARFFNRELSWLRFNQRVLEEALDARVPLAERAKFLAIVAGNLDEFVMVRLAQLLKDQREPGRDAAGYTSAEQLALVQQAIAEQVRTQYGGYHQLVLELSAIGVVIVPRAEWDHAERLSLQAYFREALEPILTPLSVGPEQPFPLLPNLGLQLVLKLQERGTEGEGMIRYALIPVPASERRLVALGQARFALLEDVLCHSAAEMFPGWAVLAHAVFRVTRDGLFDIDEDHATDLLTEIEEGLWLRGHGSAVRLEIDGAAPFELTSWLCEELDLEADCAVQVHGPLDLTFLFSVAGLNSLLQARQFAVHQPTACPVDWEEPFEALQRGALLLHHPYQSFEPVVQFMQKAAADPRVLTIKQTLYRVSGDSPIVGALIAAAAAGKQVTVLCELKARFDERRNIDWARRLEQAGAHVLYGVLGYKVHAKMLLVVRREDQGVRRYVHLGTGNYNDRTARMYEDFSYFTSEDAVCRDVSNLFNMLTGFSRPPLWERLVVAPLTFRQTMERWIEAEIEQARAGNPARIFAKVNSLVDEAMCEALYRASQSGVQIDLVVRGMCILRPGVSGLSENIRVRSVVGRFLEHSRLYSFHNAGTPLYVIGSGDWMTRNLDRRIESLLRIKEPELQAQLAAVVRDYLNDRRNSRELLADGSYRPVADPAADDIGVQQRYIDQAREAEAQRDIAPASVGFTPARKPGSHGDVYG